MLLLPMLCRDNLVVLVLTVLTWVTSCLGCAQAANSSCFTQLDFVTNSSACANFDIAQKRD